MMNHDNDNIQGKPIALLLINEHSRNGKANKQQVLSLLSAEGIQVVEPEASDRRDSSEIILDYADRIDLVIVGGGDGSLNAAAKGLMRSGLPLGVLPLGTANDFARTIGITNDLAQAVKVIAAGHQRPIDLGEVNGHLFFNVSSIGFSATLAHHLTAESKKRWGLLATRWRPLNCLNRAARSAPRWSMTASLRRSKPCRFPWVTAAFTAAA
ncbi:hypothetical protein ERHA55_47670 [Erwinia rhapontici]|nr:hypothetical protein ERHA55_47670 [Erwinia rhapontici]